MRWQKKWVKQEVFPHQLHFRSLSMWPQPQVRSSNSSDWCQQRWGEFITAFPKVQLHWKTVPWEKQAHMCTHVYVCTHTHAQTLFYDQISLRKSAYLKNIKGISKTDKFCSKGHFHHCLTRLSYKPALVRGYSRIWASLEERKERTLALPDTCF